MPSRLDKCYYWHIVTLALMKYKLEGLKTGGIKNEKV